ncbi:MAG: beta-ketoacyl-[acyl-carrier-protein] synthase family protein [Polyangiales bacterium]
MSDSPHITGWGVASALGVGRHRFRAALLRGDTGIASVRRFDTSAFTTHVGAMVAGYESDDRDPTLLCHEFGMLALRDALDHARLDPERLRPMRVALTLGASLFGDYTTESLARDLANELGISGPAITVSTACTSSTQAIGFGAELIREGFADVVLAGGIDALTPALFAGFHALGVLSEAPCTPFGLQMGTTLGEGAGFLVIERGGLRDAHTHAHLRGFGLSGDAYHETSPEPRGRGVAAAIRSALEDAGASEAEIGYLNAHGTGTVANDTAEWCAVQSVFGSELGGSLPLSSSKGHLGHAQSAAGVLEVITTLECMGAGLVPTTAGFEDARPGGPPRPVGSKRPEPLTYELALSTNSAFGGSNCALVFGKAEPATAATNGRTRVFLSGAAGLGPGVGDINLAAELPRADLRGIDRAAELLTIVTSRALAEAGVQLRGNARERTGLIAGALRASPDSLHRFHSSLEQRGLARPDTTAFAQVLPSAAQSACAKALNIRGPQSTITIGQGSGLMAAVMSAWMLARRRDSDRMVAVAVDVRSEHSTDDAISDAACALVLCTEPTPVEVSGIGLAGPDRVDDAVAEARRRWGSSSAPELFVEPPSPLGRTPATSSSFALARALDLLRRGGARSALVASTGTTASVAMILTLTEVTDVD